MRASEWKTFYARERADLGEAGLSALLDRAPSVAFPARGAVVFPHTRLSSHGELCAAVARAAVEHGADEILAIGVLHGARAEDAGRVAAARAGDRGALASLRRVHRQGEPATLEEFSLDGFSALVELCARRAGRRPPRVLGRFPFLVGADPMSLPGMDELHELFEDGLPVVASTDLVHHGEAYGTARGEQLPHGSTEARSLCRAEAGRGLGLLAGKRFDAFLEHASAVRSDFRDAGPVTAALVEPAVELKAELLACEPVDYADVLGGGPSWVAATLARLFVRA